MIPMHTLNNYQNIKKRQMKKFLFTVMAALLGMGNAVADEYVVSDIEIPQGGSATIEIGMNNPDTESRGFQFVMSFDKAVTASHPVRGTRISMKDPEQDEYLYSLMSQSTEEGFKVLAYTTSTESITGTSGTVVSITLTADESLAVGTTVTGTLSDCLIGNTAGTTNQLDDVTFSITIGEPSDGRTVLDETSTTAPEAAENVNVRVLRTIKANEWSTIVLPFAMSEAQVKTAFGDDVKLADFTSWSSEEDDEGDIMSISVGFTAIDAIEANHPCLIKVPSAISEFTVDGVDINPEDEPTVQVGKKKAERGYLTGTYVAQTVVPENNLFLSGNEFWYSTGLTKTKAFRAFFEFADVLASVENEAGANVRFVFNGGEATGVKGVSEGIANRAAGVYTLQGVRVNGTKTLLKGVYVVNGKKVVKN